MRVDLRVAPVRLRLPFRFGAVTVTPARRRSCASTIRRRRGRESADGFAAEMMVPKWFDKRAGRSTDANIDDLRAGDCELARDAYTTAAPRDTAFGLFARHYDALMARRRCRALQRRCRPRYGQALIDRAVLDALCRALGISFFDAVRANLLGLVDTSVAADLAGLDWSTWLASCSRASSSKRATPSACSTELDGRRGRRARRRPAGQPATT